MPGWLQFIISNLHIVIIILVALSGVFGKILKATKEASAQREAAIRREREELERLRTGRAEPPELATAMQPQRQSVPTRRPSFEEVAAERQRRAREARAQRRPAGAANPPMIDGPAPTAQRTRTITLPGGIVLEVPIEDGPVAQPTPRPQPQAQSQSQPPRQRRPQQPARRPQPQAQPAPAPTRPSPGQLAANLADAQDAKAQAARTAVLAPGTSARSGVMLTTGPNRRAEMRKAIVLSEMLRPPVAMREIGDDPIRDVIGRDAIGSAR